LRTIRRPETGDFQTDVRTVLPFHVTSRGSPTFTESNRGISTSSKSSVWLAIFDCYRGTGGLKNSGNDKFLLCNKLRGRDQLDNLPASQ
jgi:hypothetical protein